MPRPFLSSALISHVMLSAGATLLVLCLIRDPYRDPLR